MRRLLIALFTLILLAPGAANAKVKHHRRQKPKAVLFTTTAPPQPNVNAQTYKPVKFAVLMSSTIPQVDGT